MKRTATAAEKRHMARAKKLGCALCEHLGLGETPAEIHHARTKVGWGRDGHTSVIPLCPEHHRGNTGIHAMGRSQFAAMYGISEIDLLTSVNESLGVTA